MSNVDCAIDALLSAALPLCSAATLQTLRPLFVADSARKGEILLAQGSNWSCGFLIASGTVRVYFTRPDGREFNKNFYAEGVLVWPVTDAMWQESSEFSIAALEVVKYWRADIRAIRGVLQSHGELETIQSKFASAMLKHKVRREQDLLALNGRQRYEAFCERHPAFAERIPLAHLASYLGLTDVSLSRIRRKSSEK